jgi:hypothetical protein
MPFLNASKPGGPLDWILADLICVLVSYVCHIGFSWLCSAAVLAVCSLPLADATSDPFVAAR